MMNKYISFNELLENNEICVPIIQRDYIQGANAENINDVRKRLIEDLIDALKSDRNILDLGIIYGINKEKVFYPVDGQQRLTTLYLFKWFLTIKANKIEEFKVLNNKIMYMTRKSARKFFSFIVDNITDKENRYYGEIIDIINDDKNKNFIETIKNKIWFKYEWNNDITIHSALNIINDFIKLKISNSDAETYYNNFKRIGFHFLTEFSENAEKESAIRYIRMNSRGKQLTDFENVKALLEIIEDKIKEDKNKKEEQFVYQYDSKFIDVFYKRLDEDTSLYEKTEKINKESINLLMSIYNILVFLKKDTNNKSQYEKNEDYYIHIHNISQSNENIDDKEKKFWLEYFDMLKAILAFSYEKKELLKDIDEIFNKVYILDEECASKIIDEDRIIAYLRYIYYLYVGSAKTQSDNIEKIQKLKYVLENLQYDKWNQNRYREIDSFVKEISMKDDAFVYFSEEYKVINDKFNISCENAKILELDIDFKSIGINDIKQRFKEVSIKVRIINEYGFNYNDFKKLEEKSKCEKIQYLLYISNLWGESITHEKVEKLKKYIHISNRYFMECPKSYYDPGNKEFEWRKIFAIAANWNKQDDSLLSCEEINKNSNKNSNDTNNIWYWKDEYYFWDDKEGINKVKLNIVRQAYDLILKNELLLKNNFKEFYNGILGNKEYDMCWLKYAIDRKYKQLLCNQIRYEKNKLEILFKKSDKSYREEFIDFFPVVFYLDNKGDNKSDINIDILDPKGNISFDCFIFNVYIYENFTLWRNEKYQHQSSGHYHKEETNHNMHLSASYEIKTLSDAGNVFLYNNKNKIVYKCDFYNNNYTVFQWNICEINEEFDKFISEVNEELEDIKKEYDEKKYDRLLDINWRNDAKWIHVYDERRKDWRYFNNFKGEKSINWEKVRDFELGIHGDMKI